MTNPAVAPETPDVAETVSFLRRFAELMANGYNGAYLRRAADLLEGLTAQAVTASGEESLWQDKCEALSQHAEALEAECDALKHDIDGHLEIASSLLAERNALGGALQAKDAELAVLREALSRERDERAAKSAAHEEALNELRAAFDQKREALQATLETRVENATGFGASWIANAGTARRNWRRARGNYPSCGSPSTASAMNCRPG